jgi:hypothetical protein
MDYGGAVRRPRSTHTHTHTYTHTHTLTHTHTHTQSGQRTMVGQWDGPAGKEERATAPAATAASSPGTDSGTFSE